MNVANSVAICTSVTQTMSSASDGQPDGGNGSRSVRGRAVTIESSARPVGPTYWCTTDSKFPLCFAATEKLERNRLSPAWYPLGNA